MSVRSEADPRGRDSVPELVERIHAEIQESPDGRITFARFQERALTEPEIGYYASSDSRPTRSGDFLTAPELHRFFGRCLGRFLAAAWERLGSPTVLGVREYGAGSGRLRDSVRAGLDADASPLRAALRWQGLDLPHRDGTGDEVATPHIVVANEYLDALPVHLVVQRDTLQELYVGWRDGWFTEIEASPSTDTLIAHLRADGVELAPGQRAEVCLEAPTWLSEVATSVDLILVIDYGHEAIELYGSRSMDGTLLTYRDHVAGDDPFAAVGHSDITAHVDLTALARSATAAGLDAIGEADQARFLTRLGLGELLASLGRDPSTAATDYVAARSAVARLVDPRHLGSFRVLGWARPGALLAGPLLPGFDSAT